MASNPWVPIHRASKELGLSRAELYRMRDDGSTKLGKHYGAGPMTRSRDSYYWHVPRMRKLLSTRQEQKSSVVSFPNNLISA